MGHDGTPDHRQQRREEGPIKQVTIVGIHLAKNVFQLHGCDPTGKAVLRKQLSRCRLLGFVANLPFDERTTVFASERLTGALLDRLTHHVHILEMNGDSFRLKHSQRRTRADAQPVDTSKV